MFRVETFLIPATSSERKRSPCLVSPSSNFPIRSEDGAPRHINVADRHQLAILHLVNLLDFICLREEN